jgi:cytochrome oxidase assembly protein ShyY1
LSIGRSRLRASLALPLLFALFAFAAFVALGIWQIERKAWKEALIAKLAERTGGAPVDLPGSSGWSRLAQADDEFRRVKFTAEFLPGREAFVYASGSPLRPDVKGPGYFVFAPVRTSEGTTVVVNRGFTSAPRAQAERHARPDGIIEMVGALRWPEPAGWFVRDYDPVDDTWFARDHLGMAARNGWGAVAPFYIELERPAPPGGQPQPGRLTVTLRNEHLQYAITWFGLAAVVAVMFAFWLRSRRRNAL